jgi:hypothetical protein
MSADILKEALSIQKTNPRLAEELYKQILAQAGPSGATTHEQGVEWFRVLVPLVYQKLDANRTRDQEAALLGLGEIYRDEQYVVVHLYNVVSGT